MATGFNANRFRTTSWSLIRRARDNRRDLEELLARYWSPVYAYLRGRGWDHADAEDLTQDFLVKVVLHRDLIGRADPNLGRFRAFLSTALRRFAIDQAGPHGYNGNGKLVPTDPAVLAAADRGEWRGPMREFMRQWAATVFSEALDRVRTTCIEDGMSRQW